MDDFEDFGNVVAVPDLSTTALTNAGTLLTLYDKEDNLISWVRYDESWYGDPSKADGGWAMEKIDPNNFCQGAENWKAATDLRGGTPGMANSVMGSNPDSNAPFLLRAGYVSPNRITVFFSESMDPEFLAKTENYTITPGSIEVTATGIFFPEAIKVDLFLTEMLEPGVIYNVEVSDSLTDCEGNHLTAQYCESWYARSCRQHGCGYQ